MNILDSLNIIDRLLKGCAGNRVLGNLYCWTVKQLKKKMQNEEITKTLNNYKYRNVLLLALVQKTIVSKFQKKTLGIREKRRGTAK